MGRDLGPVQRRLLDLIAGRHPGGFTIAALALRLGLTERRTRAVVASLAKRRLLATTVEQIETQPSGRPIHGLVVRGWESYDDAMFARHNQARYRQILRDTAAAVRDHEAAIAKWQAQIRAGRCPTCGQPLPADKRRAGARVIRTGGRKPRIVAISPAGTLNEPPPPPTIRA